MGLLGYDFISLRFVNVLDIALLLALSIVHTFILHALEFFGCTRPYKEEYAHEKRQLRYLKLETNKLRAQGQPTFVETSKMERKLLAKEKEVEKIQSNYEVKLARFKRLRKRVTYILYALVLVSYYQSPVLRVGSSSSLGSEGGHEGDHNYLKGMLFPLSAIGIGNKIAHFGCGKGGLSAMMVFWSGEVITDKVMECILTLISPL
jgi:hypothetical protein